MIKAICFDLDGVFFTKESFQQFKKFLPKEVVEQEKIDHVLATSKEMMQFKEGKMSEEDFWDFANRELHIKLDHPDSTLLETVESSFRDNYNVNKNVVDYVNKVKAAGYITCICTNNYPTRIKALDAEWGFLDCFDVRVLSYEVGFMKPAKEIFQVLIDQTGVQPNEIVYSDDSESKLQGAKELGINTFVYTTFEDFVKHLEDLGVEL